ncbi:MAG: recombinase family protein [Anaerolineae bacterium]|nr:recombinase family protein [Anaerolineae bacterium]
MANPEFFKPIFDALATNGYIGDPQGRPAYCYLRVSTTEQADEGRSGLPRQIEHVHEVAFSQGYRIAWDMVYTDDDSGFEYEQRRQLTVLRDAYKSSNRRASVIIMEHLDRLSRNAEWHQGYLLDELSRYHMLPVFWKAYSSRIERTVLGIMAQESAERTREITTAGIRLKAKNGRITARWPAYGYKFVDSNGEEGWKAKRDTHYAIQEEPSQIVLLIFTLIALKGYSLRSVVAHLTKRYLPPRHAKRWYVNVVKEIIRNPVYKGEYIANRARSVKTQITTMDGRIITRNVRVPQPESEWVRIPVPPIVSPEIWAQANAMLERNRETASRNAKRQYLLSGLLYCAQCGRKWIGCKSSNKVGQKRRFVKR